MESGELLCLTPDQCRHHNLLTDTTRNIQHGIDNDYCVDYPDDHQCDWQGIHPIQYLHTYLPSLPLIDFISNSVNNSCIMAYLKMLPLLFPHINARAS